jgi:elongation factor 1-alpha
MLLGFTYSIRPFLQVDRCSSHIFQATKQEIQSMLRSPEIGLKPFMVRSKKDIDTVKNKISNLLLTAVVPISCVTGEGLDIMHKLLAALPQRRLRSKVSQ